MEALRSGSVTADGFTGSGSGNVCAKVRFVSNPANAKAMSQAIIVMRSAGRIETVQVDLVFDSIPEGRGSCKAAKIQTRFDIQYSYCTNWR